MLPRLVFVVVLAALAGCAPRPDLSAAAAEMTSQTSFGVPCAFQPSADSGGAELGPADQPPELIGGLEGLQRRMTYPERARRAGIEGTVCVQFIVDEGGSVQELVTVRSVHPLLDDEARRAVLASSFRPGYQDGEPVKVRFLLPVRFRLEGGPRATGSLIAGTGLLVLLGVFLLLGGGSQQQ